MVPRTTHDSKRSLLSQMNLDFCTIQISIVISMKLDKLILKFMWMIGS